jgi:hypothetical protein
MGWFKDPKEAKLDTIKIKYAKASLSELKDADKKLDEPLKEKTFGDTFKNYMTAVFMSPEALIAQVAGGFIQLAQSHRFKSEKQALIACNVILPAVVAIIPTLRYNHSDKMEAEEDRKMEKSHVQKLLHAREKDTTKDHKEIDHAR